MSSTDEHKTRQSWRFIQKMRRGPVSTPVNEEVNDDCRKFDYCSIPLINFRLFEFIFFIHRVSNIRQHIKPDGVYVSTSKNNPHGRVCFGEEVLHPEIRIPQLDDLWSECEYNNHFQSDCRTELCRCAVDELLFVKLQESLFIVKMIREFVQSQIVPWEYFRNSPDGERRSLLVLNSVQGRIGLLRKEKDQLIANSAPRCLFTRVEERYSMYRRMLEKMEK